jgi:argininosuccinate lyase
MQEDKEATFDAFDTVSACVDMFTRMFTTLKFNQENMKKGASRGFTNATDAADYLVRKGLPFRTAHEAVGRLVFSCIQQGVSIDECPLKR